MSLRTRFAGTKRSNPAHKDFYQSFLNYAFWLLGRKAYTEAEIHQRLKRRAAKLKIADAEKIIKKVLERLKELRYVDDEKVLENYFEYRLKTRPQGKFLFLREMRRRGISFEKAKEEWDKREIEEGPLARELIAKRERQLKGLPRILRKKRIASLLAGRGFSPETVWGILEKI